MIIKIPIITVDSHLSDILPGGVDSTQEIVDSLLNTEDISYTITDGDFTAIYLRGGSNEDGSQRSIVTTMTADQLYRIMTMQFLAEN